MGIELPSDDEIAVWAGEVVEAGADPVYFYGLLSRMGIDYGSISSITPTDAWYEFSRSLRDQGAPKDFVDEWDARAATFKGDASGVVAEFITTAYLMNLAITALVSGGGSLIAREAVKQIGLTWREHIRQRE
jgi:hypothetical protein